jgi:hypothetical protein
MKEERKQYSDMKYCIWHSTTGYSSFYKSNELVHLALHNRPSYEEGKGNALMKALYKFNASDGLVYGTSCPPPLTVA